MDPLELQASQEKWIAQGCLTWSKHATSFVRGVFPTHLDEAHGPYVRAVSGSKYIDLLSGLGAISLGYRVTQIEKRVIDTLQKIGPLVSLATPLEVQAAEMLLSEFLPTYDQVKYLKTGSEACSAAIRIARFATGRQWIYTTGYHGWHDSFICQKPMSQGMPKDLFMEEFHSLEQLMRCAVGRSAAIIVEPVELEYSDRRIQQLRDLKAHCKKTGTLLIFDEIITGARVPNFTLSKTIEPDLVVLGKGIANGYPLAAVVGKRKLMNKRYFVSSTYAGETLSLTAHIGTMKFIKNNPLRFLWERAGDIKQQITNITKNINLDLPGYPTRHRLTGPQAPLLMQELCASHLLIGASWFLNYSHLEVEKLILSAFADAVYSIDKGAKLRGQKPIEPFQRS